ncbi:MAG: peptidoglycan DD-metalloendopeptidase family protein [Deltaproteobacteria bacterium]|nr:peptidoglycan DD-metalloendopeptidase family protein [Deltaproteobacteria bacterium]
MTTIHQFNLSVLKRSRFIIVALIFVLSVVSCSKIEPEPPYIEHGVWHTVQPGENLDTISKKYAVTKLEIQQLNDIYDPGDINIGMRIFVPRVKQVQPQKPVKKTSATKTALKFNWPAKGTISSGFGLRHGRMHDGIDITKDGNREVRSAAAGTVVFSGIKKGYGRTIIISHGNRLTTLYAHNAKLYIKKGNRVRRGTIIAKMGNSGKSNGVHLHFEVRLRNKPQNPLRYLPVR